MKQVFFIFIKAGIKAKTRLENQYNVTGKQTHKLKQPLFIGTPKI